jgi:hypothetical protein
VSMSALSGRSPGSAGRLSRVVYALIPAQHGYDLEGRREPRDDRALSALDDAGRLARTVKPRLQTGPAAFREWN